MYLLYSKTPNHKRKMYTWMLMYAETEDSAQRGLAWGSNACCFWTAPLRSAALGMCCFPPESERGQRDSHRRHCPSLWTTRDQREVATQFNCMNSSKCFIHSPLPGTDYISYWLLLLYEHQWLLLRLLLFLYIYIYIYIYIIINQ